MKNGDSYSPLMEKARRIKLLLTDVDGVLTDTGVYYSEQGEILKRFSIRDGMGVQRLNQLVQVETGIITGEESESVRKRAKKLGITELHLGIREKLAVLEEILLRRGLCHEQIAYMGDDVNDIEILKAVGLSACPRDSFRTVKAIADIICDAHGGQGAFREFAEIIIASKRYRGQKSFKQGGHNYEELQKIKG